jgi:hypothetical protein
MAGPDPAIPLIEDGRATLSGITGSSPVMTGMGLPHPHTHSAPPDAPLRSYATADCTTVGPSPSSVVRRMSRTSLVSL